MQLDERFPLECLPWRAKNALLNEFNGHCPSIFEVASRSESQWLKTPGIGPRVLEQIRSLIISQQWQADLPSPPRLTNAELLARFDLMREELRLIQEALELKMAHNRK